MKENDINQLCNVYDLCKSELIAGCVQASEKDVQEWWKSCQKLLHSEKSDFRTKEKVILTLTKLLAEKSELLEKTEKLETEVAELRERLDKAVELPVKVGDTVCCIRNCGTGRYRVEEHTVTEIVFAYGNQMRIKTSYGLFGCEKWTFGLDCFADNAAAEARLKELKEEEE